MVIVTVVVVVTVANTVAGGVSLASHDAAQLSVQDADIRAWQSEAIATALATIKLACVSSWDSRTTVGVQRA